MRAVEANCEICMYVEAYILSKDFYMNKLYDVKNCSYRLRIPVEDFVSALDQCFGERNLKRLAVQMRVEDAKALLCKSPLAEVAKLCGFSHRLSLIYHFWRESGKLPSVWKRDMCFSC